MKFCIQPSSSDSMIIRNARYAMIFFGVSLLWQRLSVDYILWMPTVITTILLFLLSLLFDWAKTPYQWNKKDKEK